MSVSAAIENTSPAYKIHCLRVMDSRAEAKGLLPNHTALQSTRHPQQSFDACPFHPRLQKDPDQWLAHRISQWLVREAWRLPRGPLHSWLHLSWFYILHDRS